MVDRSARMVDRRASERQENRQVHGIGLAAAAVVVAAADDDDATAAGDCCW
jgi:hypothetical protein